MDAQRRQVREGRLERQGSGLLQRSKPGEAGSEGSTTRGRQQARLFLCEDEWHEKEANQREDGQRPQLADQQEPAGVELLTWN